MGKCFLWNEKSKRNDKEQNPLTMFQQVYNRLSTYENVSCIRKKAAVNCESQKKPAPPIVPLTLKGKRNKQQDGSLFLCHVCADIS
jgi:hypothetical protein